MYLLLILLIALFSQSMVPGSSPQESSQHRLAPGYVVCEFGGQLSWFLGLDGVTDLWSGSREVYSAQDKVPVRLGASKARKPLADGWCHLTDDLYYFTVQVLEDCTTLLPYPNGGCRKIRMRPVTPEAEAAHWTEWYTFGDAVVLAGD